MLCCFPMKTEGYQRIKQVALNYVNAMKVSNEPGVYSIAKGGGENFYASYHTTQVLSLFDELKNFSASEIDAWADYLQTFQEPDGSLKMRHQRFEENPVAPGIDDKLHSTRGLIWTFRTLDRKPKHAPTFIEPLLDSETLYQWVKAFDWSQSWRVSNQVLGVYTAMLALRDWFGYDTIDTILENGMRPALEELLDEQTGFFGTAQGAPLNGGLFGTIHITPIYFREKWDLRFVERNVDNTIKCQLADGSYWKGGANCPDFDGAYMLANLNALTDYRNEDLKQAARRYLEHALMHEDIHGRGWRSSRRDKVIPIDKLEAEFTMLDSWFYPASIALVSHILGDTGYEGPYQFAEESLHMQNAFRYEDEVAAAT